MSKLQRIRRFVTGLLMLAAAVLLIAWPETGYDLVIQLLCVLLLVYGVRKIAYYILMARHMIGGKLILLVGVLALDFGLFVFTLTDIPRIYLLLYLFAYHTFYGIVDIMRAMEARRFGSPEWKLKFGFGAVNIMVAVFALVGGLVVRSVRMPVYVYSVGLMYFGVARIVDAFRKTDVVFIEN